MRNVSFKIGDSLAESHAVQRMLFATGAEWIFSGQKVEDYTGTFINVGRMGTMTQDFHDPDYSVIDFELETVVKVIDNRPRIVFQGATYLVSDLERVILLSNVKPV